MKDYLVIIYLFVTLSAQSQSISGLIIDSISHKPISTANILDVKSNKLAISDANGLFLISEIKSSSILISHIGYYTVKLNIEKLLNSPLKIALTPNTILLDSVIISADLNSSNQKSLPIMALTVSEEEINQTPSTNIDLLLRKVPGINVNRGWGIFSRNASITMRGLTNSASVLVSLDGVPLNKLAGGTVNWNLMSSSSLSRIEVVKGPNSAQYGMNAMGGCVNMQRHKPLKKYEGSFSLYGGTYQTFGGNLYLGGRKQLKKINYYWSIDASHRKGDGYIFFPSDAPSSVAQKTFLQESSALINTGIIWNRKNASHLGFLYSKDKRGEGVGVWEKDGSFSSYNTNILWFNHNYTTSKINISILSFLNLENYFRQNENINKTGLYQYYETNSIKNDRGIKLIANYLPEIKNNTLSSGVEIRQGDVLAGDTYYTSTDKIDFQGNLIFAGIFLQDDYKISKKLKSKIAFRYDWAWFNNGQLIVSEPSQTTLFLVPVNEKFAEKKWKGFSPKVGFIYDLTKSITAYTSFSKGFLPPKIEDMTKSGKITKGFKMANPNLYPEKLNNYELGLKAIIIKHISFDASVYYSQGNDFQYFISLGDSVDVGAETLLPVLQKTNIANVDIFGTDLLLMWEPKDYFNLMLNYSYNSSVIGSMNSINPEVQKLEGKFLAEVPKQIIGVYSDIKIKGVNISLSYNYTSEQWYDDENIGIVEAYSLLNAKISKKFFKRYWLSLSVEDILDSHYIDKKGYLSPGRFVIGEVRVLF
ncbi:MAG: TonB-dependent receptor [Bacteroidota bacterium]